MTSSAKAVVETFLGIEGGGTRTVALLSDEQGRSLHRLETGPANLKLLNDKELSRQFGAIASAFPRPSALGIGLAGAWDKADWERIRSAAARVWPGVPCEVANDLETALLAAEEVRPETGCFQVLIVSGTGSACYGRNRRGEMVKVGGWGHVLGDQGSGYGIGLRALQTVVSTYDERDVWPPLGARLLRALLLNKPNDLIDWAQEATKAEVAGLAPEVFAAWEEHDGLAQTIVADTARRLADDAAVCARKLTAPGRSVQFVLSGGLLLRQERFQALVRRELHGRWPKAIVTPLARESVWGAVALAHRAWRPGRPSAGGTRIASQTGLKTPCVTSSRLSPTEERSPLTLGLDKMPLREAISLMLSEDAKVPAVLQREAPVLERAVRAIERAFRRGGRLFYVGAGTSGRLGVLDASECPPTFRTSPDLVQGIMAGGQQALWQSIEGAEDDAHSGAQAIEFRGVRASDVVVGIAASGTTPFVWGALEAAKRRGAVTVLLCFNPYIQVPRNQRPTILIAPNVGPEFLTGSTRLKAGTATKLLLNLFTTLAMVRLGKVMSNLMVDVNPSNAKLRVRARRIVRELAGLTDAEAEAALEASGWDVKGAVLARQDGRRRG